MSVSLTIFNGMRTNCTKHDNKQIQKFNGSVLDKLFDGFSAEQNLVLKSVLIKGQ